MKITVVASATRAFAKADDLIILRVSITGDTPGV